MNKEVEILNSARSFIDADQTGYICLAIMDATPRRYDYIVAARNVLTYIEEALGEAHTLEDWLQVDASIPSRQITKNRMKAYRLRYIDHLIKEFS